MVVMDNASYHSRKIEKIPNTGTKKADIQDWLRNKSISFEEDMVKPELLAIAKESLPQQKYVIDEMARASKKTVLRLPPYHCEFNRIELIRRKIKGEVARKNTTFKIADVREFFLQIIGNVSADNWTQAIQHRGRGQNMTVRPGNGGPSGPRQ
jgi:transposase